MVFWGFGAKCVSGWSGVQWMDTPQTVTTTRAPAVLKKHKAKAKAKDEYDVKNQGN